ncbi:MaoC/PaaZ C-terminal domain-containing protein [Mesorhizobium sp. BAC0120]|uniref:MaoC family dehydratase n=1 Tax=Mesorhizobium sp. BAC0120 TaxID=3090670 RepID=UPI00298BD038|nr:MaoC/PaaZ C-terminal domain-containing protein [Mesorhizobium sp. BAC0120]MDW6023387.1 MaoC/PaaZ C-terminal domain-containing protein [Mesorhizobium sp. BAC0120]
MTLDPARLLGREFPARHLDYSDRDTLLYALSLGAGLSDDLSLVHEDGQRVVPTFGQILAFDDSWMAGAGVDLAKVVHGGLDVHFDIPMAASGSVKVQDKIIGLTDKGEGKAGIILQESGLFQAGRRVLTFRSSLFVRGGGGFGGSAGEQLEFESLPEREADEIVEVSTRRDQALLFRLLGDRNPLHAIPDVARAAGFERPILHGAATFGIACLTVLQRFCAGDPGRLSRIAARFSGPLYPGETILFSFWRTDTGVAFSGRTRERSSPLLDGGRADIRS